MDIYAKIIVLVLFLFWCQEEIIAQESINYLEIDYAYGSILKHRNNMGHLVTAHPQTYSLSWHNTSPKNTKWKSRYNYPDWGITMIHQNFDNDNIGTMTALYYTTTYYLRNRNYKNQINLQMGFGIAYNTNPFDISDNNKNVLISTDLGFSQHMKVTYHRDNLFKKFGLHAGLLFTHFSNSSFKRPNLGINSIFLNAGINYYFDKPVYDYQRITEEKLTRQPYHISVSLQGGAHESGVNLGTKGFYYISTAISKKLNHISGIQAGFDFFNSQADKRYTEFKYHTDIENPDRTLLDHKQVGIFVGHHLYFNQLILDSTLGYYLYSPSDAYPKTYEKFILKHPIKSTNFSVLLGLKIHLFKAQYASAGIAYKII